MQHLQIAKQSLQSPVTILKGVGKKRALLLAKSGISTLWDVLTFYPKRYEDRRTIKPLSSLQEGSWGVFSGAVRGVKSVFGSKSRTQASVTDGTAEVSLVWFNAPHIAKTLFEGAKIIFWGKPSLYDGFFSFVNPEFEPADAPSPKWGGIAPIYHSAHGLSSYYMADLIKNALSEYGDLIAEHLPEEILKKRNFPSLKDAINEMHAPQDGRKWRAAKDRLIYDEFLALQVIFLLKRRRGAENYANFCDKNTRSSIDKFTQKLPFGLTDGQSKAIEEIRRDMCGAKKPMNRLLQGDVGCGKTIVALGTLYAALCEGFQCAYMAPTEILARQIYDVSCKYINDFPVKLLLGASDKSSRSDTSAAMSSDEPFLAVGTHALLYERTEFCKLGAVVIDEQHRFGVAQRDALTSKCARTPHLLLMTATPIPRTMCMALYGDLDVSAIEDLPPGRPSITTKILYKKDKDSAAKLLSFIKKEAAQGGQCYWVCPAIEDDEQASQARKSPLSAAVKRHRDLSHVLSFAAPALVHGKMSKDEQVRNLENFRSGEAKILVGTTVIEVGIDVPQASVIVIENPEQFGLLQLHQLRGRVGRGKKRGVCVLLCGSLSPEVSQKLSHLTQHTSGFDIANLDLKLRGGGQLSGLRQHGENELKLADFSRDYRLLEQAKVDAVVWGERDIGYKNSRAPE